jgi:hypothetical protein
MAKKVAEPKHYVAGAVFSNGFVWTIFTLLPFFIDMLPLQIFPILHTLSASLGGILAGYLTAGRSSEEHIKVGFTTGLVSSLVYTLIALTVLGTLEPRKWIWTGFIFGGVVGGAIRKIKFEKITPFRAKPND